MNELVLIAQVFLFYGGLIGMYRWLGRTGILAWSILATLAANIECLIQLNAFGMSMTGGNILFASTFLATDIVSEISGKKEASKMVTINIIISILFVVISQSWLLFQPNDVDFAFPHVRGIFTQVPRIMIASLVTYAVVQKIDIALYHVIWTFTTKRSKNSQKFLWLRNNLATIISQFINSILFNFGAFYALTEQYTAHYCWIISMATFTIYIITSFLDTPFIYLARHLTQKGKVRS